MEPCCCGRRFVVPYLVDELLQFLRAEVTRNDRVLLNENNLIAVHMFENERFPCVSNTLVGFQYGGLSHTLKVSQGNAGKVPAQNPYPISHEHLNRISLREHQNRPFAALKHHRTLDLGARAIHQRGEKNVSRSALHLAMLAGQVKVNLKSFLPL